VEFIKGRKDDMKRREGSDGREVPEGRRKPVPTVERRGGKATTASQEAGQLGLFAETADSPQGTAVEELAGQPARKRRATPKSGNMPRTDLPTMTMEEVASEENLRRAFEEVARNDGAPGANGQSIEHVRERLDNVMPMLARELLMGDYRPGRIRRVMIPKAGGGERGLGIPDVVDRVVQQAVHRVLSPHYEPTFHESSHGFRPGRSCHTAIAEAKKYLEEGYEWVVDLDLEKFFDRVNHQRLVARLEERVSDRRLIDLIWQMLKAKVVMPEGVVVRTEEGVPQGGPLSPLLSNIVLDELDQELSRRGHRFVRYADDSNIYVGSERAGHRVMASVERFIEGRMRLKVNRSKSAVARPEERHFLGFSLRREAKGGPVEVTISKRTKDRIDEKIRELTPRTWGQPMASCLRRLNVYLRGWVEFFGRSCTEEVVRPLLSLDAHIRRRLRALLLRQWKRKRFIARCLVRMGARAKTVWRVVYAGRKSTWALSHCGPVDYALNRAFFTKCGLLSLELHYREMHRVVVPVQLSLGLG
jgi:RNA-directed DNA polymerase